MDLLQIGKTIKFIFNVKKMSDKHEAKKNGTEVPEIKLHPFVWTIILIPAIGFFSLPIYIFYRVFTD